MLLNVGRPGTYSGRLESDIRMGGFIYENSRTKLASRTGSSASPPMHGLAGTLTMTSNTSQTLQRVALPPLI